MIFPSSISFAVEHIRLTYHYLNNQDFDGYSSFLSKDVRITHPGQKPVSGTNTAEEVQRFFMAKNRSHILHEIFADGSTVIALGTLDAGTSETDFADVFTVDEHGMIVEQRRFLCHRPETD